MTDAPDTPQLTVVDDADRSQYVARWGDSVAGVAMYQLTPQLIVFTHTEVDEAFEGHGVGSTLARAALDDVRADGRRKVVARCPFIKGWIDRHPDYKDLLE